MCKVLLKSYHWVRGMSDFDPELLYRKRNIIKWNMKREKQIVLWWKIWLTHHTSKNTIHSTQLKQRYFSRDYLCYVLLCYVMLSYHILWPLITVQNSTQTHQSTRNIVSSPLDDLCIDIWMSVMIISEPRWQRDRVQQCSTRTKDI